jgi:hypothetical protein
MRLAIRIFLYSILSLVIALWLAFGLFKPDYLKAPLAAWVQQQTGLPLTIGRLEFNPFYPNVLLAEQIKLGDVMSADKLYIEIDSGSWLERRISLAHLDLIAPRIELKPGQPLPSLPIQTLTIQDLNVDRLTLITPQGTLGGASFHLADWQLLQAGQWQPLAHFSFSGQANLLEWQGLHLAKLSSEGEINHGKLTLKDGSARLLDGQLQTSLQWNIPQGELSIDELTLDRMRLRDTDWPQLGVRQFSLKQGHLNHLNLRVDSTDMTVNDINLELKDLHWQVGQSWRGQLDGKVGEVAYGSASISELTGKLALLPDAWQGQLQGQLLEGSLAVSGHYQPAEEHLTLDDVGLDQWQLELPADWRSKIPAWPWKRLTIRRLDAHHLALISFDDSLPLSLKGGEFFVTDLDYDPLQGLQPASDKLRWETSWGELVYSGLTSRGGEAQGDISAASYRLRELSLPLEKSQLKAEGEWRRDAESAHWLNLTAKQLDLDKLNALLHPSHELAGNVDITLDLQSKGRDIQSLLAQLNGSAQLDGQDLFLDGIRLDGYLDDLLHRVPTPSRYSELSGKLQGGDTGINQLALRAQATNGNLTLQGAMATITHLLGLRGSLDLAHQQWQAELGLLNQHNCAELGSKLTGTTLDPDVEFRLPARCQPWQQNLVPYPPQGRRGSLRAE